MLRYFIIDIDTQPVKNNKELQPKMNYFEENLASHALMKNPPSFNSILASNKTIFDQKSRKVPILTERRQILSNALNFKKGPQIGSLNRN